MRTLKPNVAACSLRSPEWSSCKIEHQLIHFSLGRRDSKRPGRVLGPRLILVLLSPTSLLSPSPPFNNTSQPWPKSTRCSTTSGGIHSRAMPTTTSSAAPSVSTSAWLRACHVCRNHGLGHGHGHRRRQHCIALHCRSKCARTPLTAGFGASSTVYAAAFTLPNSASDDWRECAVKVSSSGSDLAQLSKEAHMLALCRHPNVLRYVQVIVFVHARLALHTLAGP